MSGAEHDACPVGGSTSTCTRTEAPFRFTFEEQTSNLLIDSPHASVFAERDRRKTRRWNHLAPPPRLRWEGRFPGLLPDAAVGSGGVWPLVLAQPPPPPSSHR